MSVTELRPKQQGFVDTEAERRALATIIMSRRAWEEVATLWNRDLFTDPVCRRVAEAVDEVLAVDDFPAPTRVLARLGKSAAAAQELLRMAGDVLTSSEVEAVYQHLTDLWRKRSAADALRSALESLTTDPDLPADEAVARAEQLLLEGFRRAESTEPRSFGEVQIQVYQDWVERLDRGSEAALPTGLEALTRALHGLRRRTLVVIAGRPSMGKSSLVGQMMRWMARNRRVRSLVFSLEQTAEEWVERAFWSELEVSGSQWYEPGERVEEFKRRMSGLMMEFNELPIRFVDKRGLSVQQIVRIARTEKLRHPDLALIVVDHLGLVQVQVSKGDSYVRALGQVVKELRNMAGELDVVMVLLAQLNRGVEHRQNKRPMLSDLRDSGEIEQDADQVIGLYREDYYRPEWARSHGVEGFTELLVLKGRQTGQVDRTPILRFIPGQTAWRDVDERDVARYFDALGGELR